MKIATLQVSLLAFRASQQLKSKYFMNMTSDFAIVAELLATFTWKQSLRQAIETGSAVEVEAAISRHCATEGSIGHQQGINVIDIDNTNREY